MWRIRAPTADDTEGQAETERKTGGLKSMNQIELTNKERRYLWAAMTIANAVTDGDAKFNEGLMLLLRDHFKDDLETIDKAFEILTTDYLWNEPEDDPPFVTVPDKLDVYYRHDPRFEVTFAGDDRWM